MSCIGWIWIDSSAAECTVYTVKSRFNESRFNVMSRFKLQNDETKMELHIKKSRFSLKSQFKESECAHRGHSLNRDFTVYPEKRSLSLSHPFGSQIF